MCSGENGPPPSDQVVLESTEWLAVGGVTFTNESDPNATVHTFPWYPMYRFIHEGYNWVSFVFDSTGTTTYVFKICL